MTVGIATQQLNNPLMGRCRKRNILVLRSLTLLLLALRMWLPMTYFGGGRMASHPNTNQNQQYSHKAARLEASKSNSTSTISSAVTELPSAFMIRPNLTFAWYRGGSILETFHSFVPLPNNAGYQVIYKVNKKDKTLPSGRAQSIETMQLSPTFERNETTRKILGASSFVNSGGKVQGQSGLSDPRAFFWNNSAYALAWRINRKDHDNFLYNLGTGEEFPLNHCIRGYRGKNWVPLVYHEQLYIVHRLSPHLMYFKYDAHNGCQEPSKNEENKTSIDEWRGGSNFVPFGPTSMIAFGHRTINGNTHVPYLIHVDMTETNEIQSTIARKRQLLLTQDKKKNWSGILDPTSLWWDEDGKLWMGTTRTSGSWKKCYFKDRDECVFNMTIYEVELKYDTDTDTRISTT
uniref:Uncharacterized protein n=1 Tax=Skeletonema marinoi TaxID=267567 RepID=A0A7S2M616_9STRA|mmetsp:Transcript_549/g.855  ORF Transcript_549/g.855 Transcript_549/m.855 type:complete len:404 (+) Transcript_549:152-1363(+)